MIPIVVCLLLGITVAVVILRGIGGRIPTTQVDERDRVVADVMLHTARRTRETAELRRAIERRAAAQVRRWERGSWDS
jgi:hypothetical protein